MEQGTPSHFEFQRRDGKRRFPNDHTWMILLEVCCARRQRHDQVVLLSQSHRCLMMSGKNAYLPLFTLLCERGIDPTESLHVTGVYAHANPHAGFAHPDVISAQVAFEREVLKDRIVGTHQTGEAVLPERDLMKGLRHLVKAVDNQVDLAALHI